MQNYKICAKRKCTFGVIFCLESRILGATAVIKATANEGYRFVKWDDESDDNPHTVTVNEDMNLTGTFETNV